MDLILRRPVAVGLGGGLILALLLGQAGAAPALAVLAGAVTGLIFYVAIRKMASQQHSTPKLDADDLEAIRTGINQDIARFSAVSSSQSPSDELMAQTSAELNRIGKLLESDDRLDAAPAIADQLIGPALAVQTELTYMLGRNTPLAGDALRRIRGRDLPAIDYAARAVAAALDRPGPVDLAAVERALGYSLEPTVTSDPTAWGNRSKLVDEADRIRRSNANQ